MGLGGFGGVARPLVAVARCAAAAKARLLPRADLFAGIDR